uniref:Dehydrogenase/reductase (SDR family) member 13b.1 n=1 Tax=Kryptolebias marmoratus TaxID=37003 RepID=A0A3Q3AWC8_KRYMA
MFTILLFAGVVIVAYIFRCFVVIGKKCTSKVKLHGKTVIVTGSNTGIGKTTAIDLAKRGARVILACRSKQRGEAALQEIKRESGSNQVVFMQLDLGSLKSVRSFAETFLKSEPRLDILINNAGVLMHGRTEDGFELMFGVNHLGHFLLTNLLLERLKECGPSRIVNVSSLAQNFGKIDFNCLNSHKALRLGTSFTQMFQIYSDSKLCNVLFTYELAKRLQGTNVTCYSLHPGDEGSVPCPTLCQSTLWKKLVTPCPYHYVSGNIKSNCTYPPETQQCIFVLCGVHRFFVHNSETIHATVLNPVGP